MPSKYIRHIDFREVCEYLPAASQGRLNGVELVSIPPQFAEDAMWHLELLVETFIPGVLLCPPPHIALATEKPNIDWVQLNEKWFLELVAPKNKEWNSDLAYQDVEWTAKSLGELIDAFLDEVWECLRMALADECDISREYYRHACGERRIYRAVSEFFSQPHRLATASATC